MQIGVSILQIFWFDAMSSKSKFVTFVPRGVRRGRGQRGHWLHMAFKI